MLTFALVPAAQAASLSRSERSLLGVVNDVRAAHNLRPLQVDAKLLATARGYSSTMIQQDVFTHGSFAERLAQSGARGPAYGENLAWGTGRLAGARNIVRMWMESPGHRANLLRPGWNRVGIGVRVGNFLGYPGATVITADFAGS
ncbi:MAG TPA: CAP domain-containing protein [Gaiellaceae bacterium]